MAGTLQTLLFLNPTTPPPHHRLPHFPTTQFSFSKISSPIASNVHSGSREYKGGNSSKGKAFHICTGFKGWQNKGENSKKGSPSPIYAESGEGPPCPENKSIPIRDFVSNNFLPLALIGGVSLGLLNPSLGCLADTYYLSKISTFAIYIISGLTMRSDEIGAALQSWPVAFFGLASILFLTPLFSKFILLLKLQPQEFVTGLALFCCMPTTLSSGVALTRLAGGNSALALAMTLISNLVGILVVPFTISKLIASGVGVSFSAGNLFKSLVLILLVPLIIGKVLRECFKGVAEFSDQNRKLLSMISSLFLSFAPFIQVSRSSSLLLSVKPDTFLLALVLGVVLHLTFLAFNALAVQFLSTFSGSFAKKQNARALLLVASQKTLPVMVAVVEQLGGALGESGLLVLPCVAAHLNQIIIDSFFANFWLQREQRSPESNVKIA